MSKDKQENKVEDAESIREAMKVLDSGLKNGRIEIPEFKPDESKEVEDMMFDEIVFTARKAKRELFRKRLWFSLASFFLFPKGVRIAIAADYKALMKSCKYLLKNKSKIPKFVSMLEFGVLDAQYDWRESLRYFSGDSVSYRMRPAGCVEKKTSKFRGKPKYMEIKSIFRRMVGEDRDLKQQNLETLRTKENDFMQKVQGVIAKVQEEMGNSTVPFKGEAAFRVEFMKCVNDNMLEEVKIDSYSLDHKIYNECLRLMNLAMDKAWKKRVECTENSKNSSALEGEE